MRGVWRWVRQRLRRDGDDTVDRSVLDRLERLGGTDLVQQMIDLFLENAPKRIEAARAGLDSGDIKAVERATHSLKTTAGNLGARRLQTLAADIEQQAAERRTDVVSQLLVELERAYAPVRNRLEKERKALR